MNIKIDKTISYVRRWPFAIALIVLAAAAATEWQSTLMPETSFVPPNPLLPVNAKDYFEHATNLMTRSIELVAPEGDTAGIPPDTGVSYSTFTGPQKQSIFAANEPAFRMLEQGLKYPYEDNSKRIGTTEFLFLLRDRYLARALYVASQDRAKHGDYAGAVKLEIDGIAMGVKITHGSPLIGMLVGNVCGSMNRHDVYNYIGKLNYTQTIGSLNRLEQIDRDTQPPYQAIVSEEKFEQCCLLDEFSVRNWRDLYLGVNGIGGGIDPVNAVYLHIESPRTNYDSYTSYCNEVIALTKLPWPDQVHRQPVKAPTDPMNAPYGNGVYRNAALDAYGSLAKNRLLELDFALYAYKILHGGYPKSLQQLTPTVMAKLPSDPFSDRKPFRYQNLGSKFLLYSIGPDAADDGGKPIFDNSLGHTKQPYRLWSPTEKGDIVAGVNDY